MAAAKVGCIQMGEQETRPGWDLKAGKLAEEELETDMGMAP